MKHILALFCIFFIGFSSDAQAPNYENLKILYADKNYEKLVKTAESYTMKDKSKKDVLPYLWLAQGLYKISLSNNDNEKYKNAYKSAIKHLGKAIKYDKKYNDLATIQEHIEFIETFQTSLQEQIENEVMSGNFKKAVGWVIKYQKVSLHPQSVKYMLGACKYPEDKTTARTLWKEANESLKETTSLSDWTKADRRMLKLGVLYSAAALNNSRQQEKAQKMLDIYTPWFEDDEDWQELYDTIINL